MLLPSAAGRRACARPTAVCASLGLPRTPQDEAGQDVPVGPSFFWRTIEDELSTVAQYYDAPSLSLRNAVYHLLREGRPGFQVRAPCRAVL